MKVRAAAFALAFILVVAFAASGDNDAPTAVIDLSQDFVTANLDNPGAKAIAEVSAAAPPVRRTLVLENGRIVANYVRGDVIPGRLVHLWSATKSITSLLIGLLVDSGQLSVNDTLGDIFSNDSPAWDDLNATEAAFTKNVTIEELLTMTSGLIEEPIDLAEISSGEVIFTDGGNAGGADLPSTMSTPSIDGTKGEFYYLGVSQILSYVIREVSGMSPRENLAAILPALGTDDSAIDWMVNADGIEYAFHGLMLTAEQMAKVGQLYLQDGLSAPNKTLISSEWVEASLIPRVEAGRISSGRFLMTSFLTLFIDHSLILRLLFVFSCPKAFQTRRM